MKHIFFKYYYLGGVVVEFTDRHGHKCRLLGKIIGLHDSDVWVQLGNSGPFTCFKKQDIKKQVTEEEFLDHINGENPVQFYE